MCKKGYFLIISLGVLLFFLFLRPGLNKANAWNPLTDVISLTEGSTLTNNYDKIPALCVDIEGNVHIVWKDKLDGNSGIYYTKLNSNGEILIDKKRITDLVKHRNPDLAVDSNGNVHIVYQSGSASYDGALIGYTKLDKNGNTVVPRKQLTSYYDYSWKETPKIAVDSIDNLHVVWRLSKSNRRIYYAYLNNNGLEINSTGTFVSGTRVYTTDDTITDLNLEVDTNNDIHIVWSDYDYLIRNDIYYLKLSNDAMTLVGPKKLNPDGTQDKSRYSPSIKLDKDGNVYIVWTDLRNFVEGVYEIPDIYFNKLDNQGIAIVYDKLIYRGWSSSLEIDSEGNMHIVAAEGGALRYRKFNPEGNAIADDAVVVDLFDSAPYYPDLGIDDDGNIHIVWNDSSPELTETYYIMGKAEILSYTIIASAEEGGSISPSGMFIVNEGENQSFNITPDANYHVADVVVDGSSVGALTIYTLTNVTGDHTIEASFDNVDLADSILALQVSVGIVPSSPGYKGADVNGDEKIGLEEVIYILQEISELR